MAQYDITLRDYWRILRRRKGIVMFTTALVGFFSFVIAQTWKETPIYTARSKIQLNTNQSAESMYMDYISSYGVGGDQMETEESVITSFPVLTIVADSLGLFEQRAAGLNRAMTEEDTTKVVLELEGRIDTEQDGGADVITIEVTHTNAVAAKDLANTVAKAYVVYDLETKRLEASRQRVFIDQLLQEKRDLLTAAEDKVKAYREETDLVSLDAESSILFGQINDGERQVQLLGQTLEDIAELRSAMENSVDFSEEVIQGANGRDVGDTFVGLTTQLNNLTLARNSLLVKFTENHPQVLEVQVQIDKLKQNLLSDLKQRAQAKARDLEIEEQRLQQARLEYGKLPGKGLELARLEREAEIAQEILLEVEERRQDIMVMLQSIVGDVVLLQKAITPGRPINPHSPYERSIMGLVLGSIIGAVFAVIAETLDTSIGTIEDVQEYTGTQVVGIVPFLNVDDVRASLRRRGIEEEDERTMERKAQLVAFFDPQSSLAENYRTLRTNIEFVTVEKGAKALMVTSSMHSEGKSTTISNLAMTMAQLGKQTLLVDCDLRRPTLPRLFGLDKEPGLTEVIVGNYEWRDVIRTVTDIVTGGMGMEDILQTQGISNLHILTSGSVPPNPAELLNSQRMGEFIADIREHYDMVLLDSPPLLHVTDAAILGKKVDGAIMVYKAGDVPRTSLKRSTSLLTSVNIDLFGVVLNGIRSDISSDFQDLSYYGYYAYGSELETPTRTVSERIEDYVRSLKKRVGLDGSEPEPVEDEEDEEFDDDFAVEEFDEDERRPDAAPEGGVLASRRAAAGAGSHAARARVGTLLLIPFLAMLLWQSGYFNRWLGLVPLAGETVLPGEITQYETRPPDEGSEPVGAAGERGAPGPAAEGDNPLRVNASKTSDSRGELVAATGEQPASTQRLVSRRPPETVLAARPAMAAGRATAVARTAVATAEDLPLPAVSVADPDRRAAGSVGAFALRIASYGPQSKWVDEHLSRLRERGESAFLQPVIVQESVWERLLVGSFDSFEASVRHGENLVAEDMADDYVVVELPFALELERFASLTLAVAAVEQAAADGRNRYWQQLPGGVVRVLAGAFESRSAAAAQLATLTDGEPARVVAR